MSQFPPRTNDLTYQDPTFCTFNSLDNTILAHCGTSFLFALTNLGAREEIKEVVVVSL